MRSNLFETPLKEQEIVVEDCYYEMRLRSDLQGTVTRHWHRVVIDGFDVGTLDPGPPNVGG